MRHRSRGGSVASGRKPIRAALGDPRLAISRAAPRLLVRAEHVVGVTRALQALQLVVRTADDEHAVR